MKSQSIPKLPESFYGPGNIQGLLAWLSDLAVIVACIALAMHSMVLYPLAVIVIGARQRALATLLHEASHRTLAKARFLNDFLGTWASGYLIFQAWHAYRSSHIGRHHGRFGTGEDPDYAFHLEIGLYDRFGLRQLWRGYVRYLRYLVVNRLVQQGAWNAELLNMLALWIVLIWWFGFGNVVLLWLVPMVLGFGPIGYAIEIAEHWPLMRAAERLYQTRNRASSWMESFFFSIHAENYHLLHHLYPRLPFKSMKKVDAYLNATWPEYRAWSKVNGGILVSANGAPSVLRLLINAAKKGGGE